MRHNKKFNHLGRKSAHRKAMLSNMASSLILQKRISTTIAKAKALRIYVEPLITKSKDDTTHARRVVFSYLQNKDAVSELFRSVSAKIADRPGGYTRILRTGNRLGDNAEMCLMELVDFNEAMLASKDDSKKAKKKRSRRGSGKKADESTPVAAAPKAAPAPKAVKAEEAKTDNAE
jgi:large subunit ribosomal protein L17